MVDAAVVLEWTGALFGLLGSALLAANKDWSRWGFVAFLLSNFCLIGYALEHRAWGLLAMQVGFTITSYVGIYRWFLSAGHHVVMPYSRPCPVGSGDDETR
jgi:hypothetical protein